MKVLGQIGMFLAVSLLLLHSVIPHEHYDEMDGVDHFESHTCSTSIFDLIQLSFHNNPGANHLEEFEVSHALDLHAGLSALGTFHIDCLNQPNLIQLQELHILYTSSASLSQLRYRGPPRLV